MMCIRTVLLFVSVELLQNVSGAEAVSHGCDDTVSGLVVTLLTTVGLATVVLMCAGDTKSVKVHHNDNESTKLKQSPAKTTPVKNRPLEHKELTDNRHNGSAKSYSKTRHNGSAKSSKTQPLPNVQSNEANKNEKVETNVNENIIDFGNDRYDAVPDVPVGGIISDENNSTHYADDELFSERSTRNEPGVSRQEVTPRDPRNEPGASGQQPAPRNVINQRMNIDSSRENTDDFGYHSDYSKIPDSDRSQQNTQRSSQPSYNARASTTNYDMEDEVIETYQDDGESIDWN